MLRSAGEMYKACVYDEGAREGGREGRNNHCSNCAKNAIFKNNVALLQRGPRLEAVGGRPERPADCLVHVLEGVTLTLKRITELKGMNEPRDEPPPQPPQPRNQFNKAQQRLQNGRWTRRPWIHPNSCCEPEKPPNMLPFFFLDSF